MPDLLSLLDWIAGILFAGALAMIAFTEKELKIARGLIWIAAALFLIRWTVWGFVTDAPILLRAVVGACAGAFVLAVLPASLHWISEKEKAQRQDQEQAVTEGKKEPSLLERMQTDFPGMDAQSGVWAIKLSATSMNLVQVIIYSDIRTMTKFVAFYVPDKDVFETCKHLAGRLKDILGGPPMLTINGQPVHSQVIITKKFEGDPNAQSSQNQVFTGTAYIYYEGYMSDEQRVELRRLFKAQGAPSLMFRAAQL